MSRRNWKALGLLAGLGIFAVTFLGPRLDGPCLSCPPARAENAPAQPAGPTQKSATLHVEGMTCASCNVTVRMALKRLDGVKDATVSRPEKRAVVTYDPAKVTPQQLADAVTKAGYPANVAPEPAPKKALEPALEPSGPGSSSCTVDVPPDR